MSKPQGTKIALIITLSILGLIIIGVIVVVVMVANFMRSEDGRKMTSTISNLSQAEVVSPELCKLVKQCQASGKWPETLEDLTATSSEDTKRIAKALFKYTKPDKDAKPETVVLRTETWEMIQGITNHVEITVSGDARVIQVTPIKDGKADRGPFGLTVPTINSFPPAFLPESNIC